jgi:hypothetical protein
MIYIYPKLTNKELPSLTKVSRGLGRHQYGRNICGRIVGSAHGGDFSRLISLLDHRFRLTYKERHEEDALEPKVEHRKNPRYPVQFKSILSTDGVHIEDGVVTDLSLEGCRLASAIHIPPDIPIEIHIRPDQHAPIYISKAVVRWEKGSVFGLEFKELPPLEAATLTRLLWLLSS